MYLLNKKKSSATFLGLENFMAKDKPTLETISRPVLFIIAHLDYISDLIITIKERTSLLRNS